MAQATPDRPVSAGVPLASSDTPPQAARQLGHLTLAMAANSVRCCPELRYIYLNNPKAGCTTVKYSLWMHARRHGLIAQPPRRGEIHGAAFWRTEPQALEGGADGPFIFSFVRNPYARLLSCYRDKIAREHNIRARFCLQFGWPPDRPVPFRDFVRRICGSSPFDSDPHWRPQHLNLLADHLPGPALVGHLETLEADFAAVTDRIGAPLLGARLGHATGAADHLDEYDDETIALVADAYRRDFDLFGYSRDVSQVGPFTGPVTLPRGRPAQVALLRSLFQPNRATATALVEGALRREPIPALQLRRLQLRFEAGDEIDGMLEPLARAYPDEEVVLGTQRALANRRGDREEEARLLARLAALFPHRQRYRLDLARLRLREGRSAEALVDAEAALQLRPTSKGAALLVERIARRRADQQP